MRETTIYNPHEDLIYDNVYTKCGYILSIHSQDMGKKQTLASIKGHNSVANLRKTTIHNPNDDNVYTKLCLILSIRSQDIELNQILTSIKGRSSVSYLRKMTHHNPNVDLVNNNVYTKFGIIQAFHSQDIEQNLNNMRMAERKTE